MTYKLILEVTDVGEDIILTEDAHVEIDFPQDAYFSTHAMIANAFTPLIPLLLSEALNKIAIKKNPEEDVGIE
jgi:3-oxoacyl-[acyl-carrier-protein] synthase III